MGNSSALTGFACVIRVRARSAYRARSSNGGYCGKEAFHNTITPVLSVRNTALAVAFFQRAFGAEEIYRNARPHGRFTAEMSISGARFTVDFETAEASNFNPQTLQKTSVRLNLLVADPDAFAAWAISNGRSRSHRPRIRLAACVRADSRARSDSIG